VIRLAARLTAVISVGYLTFSGTQGLVFEHFITAATASVSNGTHSEAPDIPDLQHTSMLASLAGAALGLFSIELIIQYLDHDKAKRDAIKFLHQQSGNPSLPEAERVAIAYILQDLVGEEQ